MTAPHIRANYDQLNVVVQQFANEAAAIDGVLRNLAQNMDALEGGDWIGRGARAFYDEMRQIAFPALARLRDSLALGQQVTAQVRALMQTAEREAAAAINRIAAAGSGVASNAGAATGAGASNAAPNGASNGNPGAVSNSSQNRIPPRNYVINGINNNGTGLAEMAQYLTAHGYDPAQAKTTPGIYNTNLSRSADGLPDGAFASIARGALGIANILIGSGQVVVEYITGGSSQANRVSAYVAQDLAANPLIPGQGMIFMGHSGGGAVAATMAVNWENQLATRSDGSDTNLGVQGVVALPATLAVAATNPLGAIAGFFGGESVSRSYSGNLQEYTADRGGSAVLASHSGYWTSDQVWNMLDSQFKLAP